MKRGEGESAEEAYQGLLDRMDDRPIKHDRFTRAKSVYSSVVNFLKVYGLFPASAWERQYIKDCKRLSCVLEKLTADDDDFVWGCVMASHE